MTEPTLASLAGKPWWRTDDYSIEEAISPKYVHDWNGPFGLALVRAWSSGMTDPGWGLQGKAKRDADDNVIGYEPGFMENYRKGVFNERRCLYGYERDKWAFAFVMRSMRMVCIDIDGKNGGLEHAKELGHLPPTMAETSKSGDGYHLFYLTEEEWDDAEGYGAYHDHIGAVKGVDIRAVGCVYHHKQQRWNNRAPAVLPKHVSTFLQERRQKSEQANQRITSVIQTGDPMETLMLHDELVSDLKKPIQSGKRNTTLFAIGQKMKAAGVQGWEELIEQRALQVGLDTDEVDQLVRNITRYN